MANTKPPLTEGILSNLLGKAILFLSGAGKDYKELQQYKKDPEFKRQMAKLRKNAEEVAVEFDELRKKYNLPTGR